jgi:protein-disulfide isomerase
MKAVTGSALAALALMLAGCGGGDDGAGNGQAAATANVALPQIAAPNGDWSQTVSETPQGGYVMGNPAAPLKLVEYASITCPHCAEFSEQGAETLTNKYVKSGQVSWEYRPFMIFPTDPGIFALLKCQGATPFFTLVEQLYADQGNWSGRMQNLTPQQQEQLQTMPPEQRATALVQATGVDQFLRQRGMPEGKINACLADRANLEKLVKITDLGVKEGVTGTPSFFINGKLAEDVGTWPALEKALQAALK